MAVYNTALRRSTTILLAFLWSKLMIFLWELASNDKLITIAAWVWFALSNETMMQPMNKTSIIAPIQTTNQLLRKAVINLSCSTCTPTEMKSWLDSHDLCSHLEVSAVRSCCLLDDSALVAASSHDRLWGGSVLGSHDAWQLSLLHSTTWRLCCTRTRWLFPIHFLFDS